MPLPGSVYVCCVRVRDTGDSNNAPSIKAAHLLAVALNRQIDKGNPAKEEEVEEEDGAGEAEEERPRKQGKKLHEGKKIEEYMEQDGCRKSFLASFRIERRKKITVNFSETMRVLFVNCCSDYGRCADIKSREIV